MTTPAERTEAMTEPTRAQIEEAHKFAINYGADRGYYYEFQGDDIANLIAHIRREARNAALEEAAQLCHERMMSMRYGRPVFDDEDEDDSDQWCAHGAEACRNAIRALKDQP